MLVADPSKKPIGSVGKLGDHSGMHIGDVENLAWLTHDWTYADGHQNLSTRRKRSPDSVYDCAEWKPWQKNRALLASSTALEIEAGLHEICHWRRRRSEHSDDTVDCRLLWHGILQVFHVYGIDEVAVELGR